MFVFGRRTRGPGLSKVLAGALVGALALLTLTVAAPAQAAARSYTSLGATADGQGYVAVSSAGEVYAFGTAVYRGNPTGFSGTIKAISVTADGRGYAAISSAGQVYAYGTVVSRGNPTGFSGTMVGISVTADGQGYAAISSTGQVYAYGTVVSRGNPTGFTGSMVGISVTGNGQGYAAMSSIGQVYAYGTVVSRGNPTGFTGSMVGISTTKDGQGYAAVSSAGQVYAYGTVVSRGNPTGFTNGVVGISASGDGQGYAAISGYGQVYSYGTVRYWGNGDPGSSSTSAVRSGIGTLATAQANNSFRRVESPARSNCNYYTSAVGGGVPNGCLNSWYSHAWCADFAKWVWGQNGAKTDGLNALAASFKSYGTSKGTWHAGSALTGVQVGDVIVYNQQTGDTGDDHVGVVVGLNSDNTVATVDGNFGDIVAKRVIHRSAINDKQTISGYTSPVT